MTATAERRLSPHGPALRGPLTKFRYIGWNADIGSRLPDPQGKLGLATAVDQFQTQLVAYGAQIDLRFLLGRIVEEIPQCRCIAFYDFAQTVTDGFEQVVTGGQTVGTYSKATTSRRRAGGIIRMYDFMRHPDRSLLNEVITFDPKHRPMVMKSVLDGLGKRVGIQHAVSATHFLVTGELERIENGLSMVGLYRLHHTGSTGGVQIHALPLENRQRPGVRPASHDDRDSDLVEPSDVGHSSNAHRRQHSLDAFQSPRRGLGALCSSKVNLRGSAQFAKIQGRH